MSELSDAAARKLETGVEVPPKRGRGRPKGSKNRPKDEAGNPIPPENPTPAEPGFVYVEDEASIAASRMMGETAWYLASMMLPVRPLNDEEADKFGRALDPVLCRWLPIFGNWKYEINLLIVMIMLIKATKVEKTKPVTEEPESDIPPVEAPNVITPGVSTP